MAKCPECKSTKYELMDIFDEDMCDDVTLYMYGEAVCSKCHFTFPIRIFYKWVKDENIED